MFDAWGFDRCLWGTDWTRAYAVVNYEQAVEPFLKTDRLSDNERAMLVGGACAYRGRQSVSSRRFQTCRLSGKPRTKPILRFIAFSPPLALPASALPLQRRLADKYRNVQGRYPPTR
jgi:hypothetical protein